MWNPIFQQCADLTMQQGGIIPTLFLAGFAGSLSHCSTMCSPFVIAQIASTTDQDYKSKMLLPYHAGRIATYGILGLLSAALGAQIASFVPIKQLAAILLVMAASLFLFSAFGRFLPKSCSVPGFFRGWIGALQSHRFLSGGFGLGLLLGFLPCGLLYAALLASAASQNAWMGMMGMIAFGLGTMPLLIAIAFGAQQMRLKIRHWTWLGPVLSLFNSFFLLVIAGGLIT